MEAFVQHFLYAGLQTGEQSSDVLHKNAVQGFCQVVQTAVSCDATVFCVCVKELELCCPGFSNIAMADDVLLTSVDNPCE